MSVQPIQFRSDTAANATAGNPTLALGEPGYEWDTNRMKVGDGVTPWNGRPYLFDPPIYLVNADGALLTNALGQVLFNSNRDLAP